VQATSLGVEGMVITDLIARHHLPIVVATLDTGALHAETLALIPRIEARYGIRVERFAPRWRPRALRAPTTAPWPCARAWTAQGLLRAAQARADGALLAGHDAWITGLRREQSDHRADVPFSELDADGRTKFYPLADWSLDDVWHYVQVHDVPYNELHDQDFPSIGCQPCTRAVAPGEDFRAGRWWWEQGEAQGVRPAQPAAGRSRPEPPIAHGPCDLHRRRAGAADLITVRGAQRLASADVVLFDALTDPALRIYAPRHAGSTSASVASSTPRRRLHRRAAGAAGARACRGGAAQGRRPQRVRPPGRRTAGPAGSGIPCEVVPGVTAALAAAAGTAPADAARQRPQREPSAPP
jgi:phosphoadenosine phosphosulfate reductase